MSDVANHDCGHTCCPIRNDRFHDHFLSPARCPACGLDAAAAKATLAVGYPGQPPMEQAWVRHASEAIADAIKGGATGMVMNVPTQHGEIQFDEAAHLTEQMIRAACEGGGQTFCNPIPCPPLEGLGEERVRLRRWKAEAIEVLNAWERVWEAAGKPGPWGGSKAENTEASFVNLTGELLQKREELAEFKQWASDVCELLHLVKHAMQFQDEAIELLARMETP